MPVYGEISNGLAVLGRCVGMTEQSESNDLMTLVEVALRLDAPASFVAQLVARDAIPFERPRKKGLGRFKTDELRFRRDEMRGVAEVELAGSAKSKRLGS